MPQFSYKARRRSGEVVDGVLEAADRTAAVAQLERMGLFPVRLDGGKPQQEKTARKSAIAARAYTGLLPPAIRELLFRPPKPNLRELAMFTQQLANLLRAGMPVTAALNSMTSFKTRRISTEVSQQLLKEVMEGRSLSDAMSKQPHVFSDLYVNMVRAGEQSGALVDVLQRMAAHFNQFAEVQGRFTSALIYPAMVVCVGFVIVGFFMLFVLPQFTQMFTELAVQLPLPTRVLIGLTNFVTGYWWVIALVLLALGILFRRFSTSEEGRRKLDMWKLQMPIFGRVIRLNLFSQFARTLSILLHNGVPVLVALRITEQVMPNRILKEAVATARDAVTDGKSLAQPLAQSGLFPQMMIDLVRIGEDTGNVADALANVAETLESELQLVLRVLMNLIEPVLIILMALVVVLLLISVLLPIFTIVNQIRTGPGQ